MYNETHKKLKLLFFNPKFTGQQYFLSELPLLFSGELNTQDVIMQAMTLNLFITAEVSLDTGLTSLQHRNVSFLQIYSRLKAE